MATYAEDRAWVISVYTDLHGHPPSAWEADHVTQALQSGQYTRARWAAEEEGNQAEADVIRIFREIVGTDPNPDGVAYYANRLRAGQITRAQMREEMAAKTAENKKLQQDVHPNGPGADTAANDDARARIDSILRDYGLESLSGWAWEQLQAGNTEARILHDLRERPEYKQRFAGMELRRAAGFNAISEAEYLSLENQYGQIMRAAGLPPGFYDDPSDYATFIGKNVSPQEVQARVNDGYLAAAQAPQEVKDQLRELYGINTNQLAAYYLDPNRALPALQQQFAAAQISGAGQRSGYGALTRSEAERYASLGVAPGQAAEAFDFLVQGRQLFTNLPGEDGDEIGRDAQLAATLGDDALARRRIRRRQETRVAAGSGAQSFAVGQGGVIGLAAEDR